MEDKCISCGADVSDLSMQVCNNCINRTVNLLNQNKMKRPKIERYYREYWQRLLHRRNISKYFFN